ncbi:MAG: YgiQ family radical SAM protein, partial [Campylobacterales bacterium]|nr:YgiQ family radical SAM protein [Campylobacterales bacterium]
MKKEKQFLPTTRAEMERLGWDQCDVILVSGDAYIDSPFIGVAVVGRMLEKLGYRVGIIGQPDVKSDKDIKRLGEPRLYWGVSGGSIDSMVANYTATKKFRKSDDYTPGGKNTKRPDRAVLAYTNLIRQNFKNTVPIVLGGIEASLRRVTHYDYWSNKLRKPILFDAKADIIVYGMGEEAVRELTRALDQGKEWRDIRGLCYISKEPV